MTAMVATSSTKAMQSGICKSQRCYSLKVACSCGQAGDDEAHPQERFRASGDSGASESRQWIGVSEADDGPLIHLLRGSLALHGWVPRERRCIQLKTDRGLTGRECGPHGDFRNLAPPRVPSGFWQTLPAESSWPASQMIVE